MGSFSNIHAYERIRISLLKRLSKVGPFIKGSLVTIERPCGYPHCRCAKGPGHESFYLTYKWKAKTQTLYIPRGLETEVAQWTSEYQKLKMLIAQMDDTQKKIVRRYVKEKRAKAKKKA